MYLLAQVNFCPAVNRLSSFLVGTLMTPTGT
jgi:hypothetical protein